MKVTMERMLAMERECGMDGKTKLSGWSLEVRAARYCHTMQKWEVKERKFPGG